MTEQPQGVQSPHGDALQLEKLEQANSHAKVAVPYSKHLVGDPETGVIHGGVITTLLDTACGMAVRSEIELSEELAIATLDLRIDYMRSAVPGETIYAEAECYRRTQNVAFVRGTAYQQANERQVAACSATFMLGTPNTRRE